MESTTSRRANNRTHLIVLVLLFLLSVQTVSSMKIKSPTFDEPYHLTSGFLSLTQQDFRYGTDHPPFIKSFAALPLLSSNLQLPENYSELMEKPWPVLGKRFLFQPQNNVERIIFLARLPIVFMSILLGFYVFLWSKNLYGNKAGILALILYVFSPNILAHSRLVTTDLGSACFIFVACYYYRAYMIATSFQMLCLAGFFTGLALASKFSALILFPIFLLVAFARLLAATLTRHPDSGNSNREGKQIVNVRTFFIHLLIFSVIALAVVFFAYGMSSNPVALYKEGLHSLQRIYFNNKVPHLYFLMGTFYTEPFRFYHVIVFLIKTPIPSLILLVWAAMLRRGVREKWFDEACILVPIILFSVFSFFDHEHTGVRRILPIYPFLFIFVARVAVLSENFNFRNPIKPIASVTLTILVIWYVVSSFKNYPDYLTYFNELVGGAKNGIHYLDNANLDWGQDLKRLKPLMDELGIKKIKLMYEGQADSNYYKIPTEELTWEDRLLGPQSGYYAISAHYLIRLWTIPTAFGYGITWKEKKFEPIAVIGHTIYIFKF